MRFQFQVPTFDRKEFQWHRGDREKPSKKELEEPVYLGVKTGLGENNLRSHLCLKNISAGIAIDTSPSSHRTVNELDDDV